MSTLAELPNIGSTLLTRLHGAGITTMSELVEHGAVGAALRIRAVEGDDGPCQSMLFALEGAIRGIRWHAIPKADRQMLWREYVDRAKGE